MGVLIEGVWRDEELPQEVGRAGEFRRADSIFRDRVTADGSSEFKAEPDRYHLYVSHGCPWAHRTLIYRAIKKLDGLISVAYAIPGLKQNGWTFEDDPRYPDCIPDKINGFHHLYEAYVASNPTYTGKVTVPTLWDKKTKKIVNNESSEIIRMFNTEFNAITGDRTDLYPQALRGEIDAVNERIYHNVNNGVYRAGFAKTQAAYEEAYDELFATLDWLEQRLSRQRYLVGGQITEADWRLFPTLVRFDVAYFSILTAFRPRFLKMPREQWLAEINKAPLKRRAEYKRSVIEHGLDSEFVTDALGQHQKMILWMVDDLKSGPYLGGDAFTNADCAVIPYILRLELLKLGAMWQQHSAVADWWDRVRERPSVKTAIFDRMSEADWAPFKNLAPDPWPKVQLLLKAA